MAESKISDAPTERAGSGDASSLDDAMADTAAPLSTPLLQPGEDTYADTFIDQARILCQLGASDVELGQAFGVSAATVRAWRTRHPDFAQACTLGEEAADQRVASALFNRAVGYSYDAQELVKTKDGVDIVTVTKHAPPDLASCIFWLKNRQPKTWRDKIDPRLTDEDTRPPVTDEERAKAAAVLLAKQAVLEGWDEARAQARTSGQNDARGEDRTLHA